MKNISYNRKYRMYLKFKNNNKNAPEFVKFKMLISYLYTSNGNIKNG